MRSRNEFCFEPIGACAAQATSTTAAYLTRPARATGIMIQNLDATDEIGYTFDGTTPTVAGGLVTKGFVLPTGSEPIRLDVLLTADTDFKFIASANTPSFVYQWYRSI